MMWFLTTIVTTLGIIQPVLMRGQEDAGEFEEEDRQVDDMITLFT